MLQEPWTHFQAASRADAPAPDDIQPRDIQPRDIAALSSALILTDPRQPHNPIVFCNPAFEQLTGYSREETLGRNCRFLQGEGTDAGDVEMLRQAILQVRPVHLTIRNYRRDGTPFWNELTVAPVRDESGAVTQFVGVQTDVTERHETALRRQTELREKVHLVDNAHDVLVVRDMGGKITFFNPSAERLFGFPKAEAEGRTLSEFLHAEYPASEADIGRTLDRTGVWTGEVVYVRRDGVRVHVESHQALVRGEDGRPVSVLEIGHDVTERRQAEREVREARDFAEAIVATVREPLLVLDGGLRVVRVNRAFLDMFGGSREQAEGRLVYELGDGQWDVPALRRHLTETLSRSSAFQDFRIEHDFPLVGRKVMLLNARRLERAGGGDALILLAMEDVTEREAAATRGALLYRIGQALRDAPGPEAAQEEAVRLLGEALKADRCYLAVYDLGHGLASVARDWHRTGLKSIQGVHPFTNTATMFRELYRDSTSSNIGDTHCASLSAQSLANLGSLGLRSHLSVALVDGEGLTATLTAAMTDTPRAWSAEEAALVEATAAQLRAVVEMARVAQRERNIATHLQKALQPALPGTIPGLALTKYYEAALEEAEVGGDFYDVFAIKKGRTALAVGDLSGKGLAAAAQVGSVRNMLRAFLYSRPTVAGAVAELNRVLAENNLLTGFTTLFVGAYDSATGRLTYVNCGQEPALVRRAATGAVEPLEPTGPVLGAIEGAVYEERQAALSPGDALAIFTDGLTEVGANRTVMLGVEGVASLLAGLMTGGDAEQRAESLVLRLIAGVDEFARTGARDDMCLLVGVVQ